VGKTWIKGSHVEFIAWEFGLALLVGIGRAWTYGRMDFDGTLHFTSYQKTTSCLADSNTAFINSTVLSSTRDNIPLIGTLGR
jgi:hypothetical protein